MEIRAPGAPSATAYLESVRRVVTPQRFAVAVDAIFRRAERDGDLEAFKAVAPYVVGPMRQIDERSADDVVMRIIAVVERRRELLGGREVLTSNEIEGEYSAETEEESADYGGERNE